MASPPVSPDGRGCCLLLISDGREDYLQQTVASMEANLPVFEHVVHVDDARHELGFAGAIQAGWDRVLATDCEFVFHLEADFTFNRPVPLERMRDLLDEQPHLVQVALLRQPWNPSERAAGGVWQQHPDEYIFHDGWFEHARYFTTNPCLYPRWVAERGWPQVPQSEGMFGLKLFAEDPVRRSAFLGAGEEWVEHIGLERAGGGY